MRLLLDTHVWVWSLLDPGRLGSRARSALQSGRNELWLSSISVWELLILVEKRRLTLHQDPHAWLAEAFTTVPLIDAPITREVAVESRRVALSHPDPADRFIAASARVFDLTLVTADRHLLDCPGLKVLAGG